MYLSLCYAVNEVPMMRECRAVHEIDSRYNRDHFQQTWDDGWFTKSIFHLLDSFTEH